MFCSITNTAIFEIPSFLAVLRAALLWGSTIPQSQREGYYLSNLALMNCEICFSLGVASELYGAFLVEEIGDTGGIGK